MKYQGMTRHQGPQRWRLLLSNLTFKRITNYDARPVRWPSQLEVHLESAKTAELAAALDSGINFFHDRIHKARH